jgi:hypothetical protein
MQKPRNVDEYLDLIDQAIFEINELIMCAEDENDGEAQFGILRPDLKQIEDGLKALLDEIKSGNYAIGRDQDLPFMPVVQKVRRSLPIAGLIDTINITHKKGLAKS